jgi:translocating chain-associated membrane protein 1
MEYTFGYNDIFCILFYTLVFIVTHGVIQQYLLDRSARKLHMSKIKHSKFNESGQLLTFYVASMLWAVELLRRDRLTKRNFTETIGGPQDTMSYGTKLYFIVQIAYWLHSYPEFYLQRIRKEEINQRFFYVTLYFISFLGAYVFNQTRLMLVLVLLHYAGEAMFHLARILYFRQNESYPTAFKVWNGTFVASRLISITLSILVLALGLGTQQLTGNQSQDQQASHVVPSTILRYFMLSAILAIQIYLMWKYLVFHLGRMRPTHEQTTSSSKSK